MATYKLSSTLIGHSLDVRCLAVADGQNEFIVSGSRDTNAKVWSPVQSPERFTEIANLHGHTSFVACVCVVPPDELYPTGLILTGSNDKSICAFNLESTDPLFRLTGHSDTVCALATGKFGTVISGSWDHTAKLWLGKKCMLTMQGHESAVWCVAIVTQQGITLTGSADKTIKMWRAGRCERTFLGHTDCVRALAIVSDVEFLSSSNDGSIKKWLITGECIASLQAHESFVYSIAVFPGSSDFVSSGEDRTLRIWKNEKCSQVIRLPTQSVWAAIVLKNGDVVTGAGDSMIRIFSSVPERQASPDMLNAYEEEIASSTITSSEIGNIKVNELPGKEVLYEPGKRDGQIKMVREDSKVIAYQWCLAESRWIKIGDVVGSTGGQASGRKITFEGKEYDYVFDVDIQEGRPPLKLPYNATDDPWFAAQRFLQRNDLDQMFLDQVANFIIKNTEGMTLTSQHPTGFADPFTGESRYVPGGPSESVQVGNDPFTGSGRYVPPTQQSSKIESKHQSTYFPHTSLLVFDTAKIGALQSKLREFNLKNVSGNHKMEDAAIDDVMRLADVNAVCTPQQIDALERLLLWPTDVVYPVLDLLRLAIRRAVVNERFCGLARGNTFLELLLGFLHRGEDAVQQMLCLRVFSNMIGLPAGESLVIQRRHDIIEKGLQLFPSENKHVQIGFATLLLNYAILFLRHKDFDAKSQCMSAVVQLLSIVEDRECQFRLLVAAGTLIWDDQDSLAVALSLDVLPLILKLTSTDSDKLNKCAVDFSKVLGNTIKSAS